MRVFRARGAVRDPLVLEELPMGVEVEGAAVPRPVAAVNPPKRRRRRQVSVLGFKNDAGGRIGRYVGDLPDVPVVVVVMENDAAGRELGTGLRVGKDGMVTLGRGVIGSVERLVLKAPLFRESVRED